MSYKDSITYLYNLQRYGIKFGLNNTIQLMSLLDKPHIKFKSLHITGTNGKGSTAAMLASILQTAGYRIGLYTSPHLVSFTERIKINGRQIPEEKIVELTERIRNKVRSSKFEVQTLTPTFFEFTTALAFTYFAEEDVEIGVIEVGMGGRLDATNVITPLVSVITNVGYEHQEFLGSTLKQIAWEKAGIIKEDGTIVTAAEDEALEVIGEVCQNKGARLYQVGRDARYKVLQSGLSGLRIRYNGLKKQYDNLNVPLLGRHQGVNTTCALLTIECLNELGLNITEGHIRKGLKGTIWEGRLEIINRAPLILLDGAHNPSSAKRLGAFIKEMFSEGYDRLILVMGILKDKDIPSILKELVPLSETVIITRPAYSRAAEPLMLKKETDQYNKKVLIKEKIPGAIECAKGIAGKRDIICITGSLYTVGEAKEYFAHIQRDREIIKALPGLKG